LRADPFNIFDGKRRGKKITTVSEPVERGKFKSGRSGGSSLRRGKMVSDKAGPAKHHPTLEGIVDIFRVQHDGSEDLVVSGLHPAEVDGIREWFCYTKPIGRGMRIVVRPTSEADSAFSVQAAGTEP